MRNSILIFSFLLVAFSSCKKEVADLSPEFIGYWSGGSYNEYGFVFIKINEPSSAYIKVMDYSNDHEYSYGGAAGLDGDLLYLRRKYFKIVEYPHIIDTSIERKYFTNHIDNSTKLANWKMVLDGLYNSHGCNVGKRAYYKADY